MQSIRGGKWFVVMIVGSMALPPQSQIDVRSTGKGISMIEIDGQLDDVSSTISSNGSNAVIDSNASVGNSIDVDVDVNGNGNNDDDGGDDNTASSATNTVLSKPVSPDDLSVSMIDHGTSLASSSSSSSLSSLSSSLTPILTDRSSLGVISSTTVSSGTRTESAAPTATATTTITKTTGTTGTTGTIGTTSTAANSNIWNASSSVAPTETSSRTIVAGQDAATFLSASKKSTNSFNQSTTTPASISPKETRESPGKIRPQIKLTTTYTNLSETGVRLPEGASAALAKPTKYHYYPHNQHIYLLPECAVQQVCNAVYVRLNFTQPLCACPGRYRDPCSASLDSDDLHTTELVTDPRTKALTLVKTCEPVAEMRECRTPRDWSLLALQNVRTGKSHYLVICRCPDANILEGPMSHDQPTYASVPGIRVYGMMCVQGSRRGRPLRYARSLPERSKSETSKDSVPSENEQNNERLSFPWYKVQLLMNSAVWD